jgi:aspartyl-tRNA synthetase
MHPYRTHTCGELRPAHTGARVRLSGWVHRKRDHGNLLFIDLRDHYGLTQCVIDVSSPLFSKVEPARVESVITVTGTLVARSPETVNPNLPTGEVELRIEEFTLNAEAEHVAPGQTRTLTPARTSGCVTGFSICAAKKSTATSFCARRSFPASAGA